MTPKPPCDETYNQPEDHVEDRVPSSDIHTERSSDGGSKDKAQDYPS